MKAYTNIKKEYRLINVWLECGGKEPQQNRLWYKRQKDKDKKLFYLQFYDVILFIEINIKKIMILIKSSFLVSLYK